MVPAAGLHYDCEYCDCGVRSEVLVLTMATSVSLNLRVTTPGVRKGEKRRPKGPEAIEPHIGHSDSKLINEVGECSTVEAQVEVVKKVSDLNIITTCFMYSIKITSFSSSG